MIIALITGITGQDGSYLTELLLEKGYDVWGIIRRSSQINTQRINHLYENKHLFLRYGDMSDGSNLLHILFQIKTKYENNLERLEIYNLAAMSHVKVSFELPEYTGNVDGLGTLRLLEAIRSSGIQEKIRLYQASTSELYGKVMEIPQTETTPFYPRSPYGVAKLYSYWIVKNYREAYNIFACNGILFNHESPRRGPRFVTRKITRELSKILKGESEILTIGNLDAKRDWGHARDYVEGMWRMLQQDHPDDYVLATNEQHSVREFIEKAFAYKNMIIEWKGEGIHEKGYVQGTVRVEVSERYFRQTEVETLLGDATKAYQKLGWKATTGFDELVKEMVDGDI